MNPQWPAERRIKAAAGINQRRPWLKSTGPTSTNGKAIVSLNGWKHGRRSRRIDALKAAVAEAIAAVGSTGEKP